jgi:hypothetical protein
VVDDRTCPDECPVPTETFPQRVAPGPSVT